jgi:hypothetical protein
VRLWSGQTEGVGGPAQPSPTTGQCLNGGYGRREVMRKRCETRASLPLDAIRRPRVTPIWKLEAALKCRSCRTSRYSPPPHMIRLTKERLIARYVWVHHCARIESAEQGTIQRMVIVGKVQPSTQSGRPALNGSLSSFAYSNPLSARESIAYVRLFLQRCLQGV